MKKLAITVNNVSKNYGSLQAVDSLSFKVEAGKCFGMLGPNGAGKSTMMRILYGKTRRNQDCECEIDIFGFDPLHNELQIKFLSGIVQQEDNLDSELSVFQNLIVYSKFYGMKKRVAVKRIDELLDFMELSEKKKSKIRELSGGLKRRLVIARALLNNPKLLLLDEPTTGLDPQVRHIIWDKLRMLKNDGVTIILTTHYMEEAFQLCDDLIIMYQGKKVVEGIPSILVQDNIEKYVMEILNTKALVSMNIDMDHKVRKEDTGSRMLLYSDDLQLLEDVSGLFKPGEYFLRQSNLEDLFLKTTGRVLND